MNSCCATVLTLLVCGLLQGTLSYNCNEDVVQRIKALWTRDGVPRGLLAKLSKARVSYIVASSPGMFEEEDRVRCLEAITEDEGVYYMNIAMSDGSVNVTDKYTLQEKHGDLYTPGDEQHRYHIPTVDGNVQAFYTCMEHFGKAGPPRGLIRVLGTSRSVFTQVAVRKAERDLAQLGIEVTKAFPDHCLPVM